MSSFNDKWQQSSFNGISNDEFDAHLAKCTYGDFVLTDAIRPAYRPDIILEEGYRHEQYRDDVTGERIPVIMAAVSREKLFNVFMDLLDPLGEEVDVVLETSHNKHRKGHDDLYREHIDLPVLASTLYDFEDILLNDGCTGIAVLNPETPMEVQLDEHKLLMLYGQHLHSFSRILRDHRIQLRKDIRFITEDEHMHSSSEEYEHIFKQLQYRLGLDDE